MAADHGNATGNGPASPGSDTLVDPRAPRFGQALTAVGLTVGVVLGEPLLVGAVAVVLVTSVLSGWRLDLWATTWRRAVRPLAGPPDEREPAAPHRFAKLLGAGLTALATAALGAHPLVGGAAVALGLSSLELVGYGFATLVAALAGLAAATDVCLGCRLYRQVSYVRRLGVV